MRFVIAVSILAVVTSQSMAAEKSRYIPPKQQWVEITKPVIGCFLTNIGGPLINSPEVFQGIETGMIFENKKITCSLMNVGEHYILETPVDKYTSLLSVICEHCAPSAYVVYTKAKTGFYKPIPAPETPIPN